MPVLPILYGILATPIIFGTLLVIDRRDLTVVQSIGLLLLVWLIPGFGFLAVLAYLWFVLPRRRQQKSLALLSRRSVV